MLEISQINLLNLKNRQNVTNKQQTRFMSIPNFAPKYQYNLNADTISFQGKKKNIKAINTVQNANRVVAGKPRFSEQGIEEIVNNVTSKNQELLEEILEVGNKRLRTPEVVALLKHINEDDVKVEEMREKINNFNNLENIVRGFGFTESPIANHINEISSRNTLKMLKSSLLLKSATSNNLNSFPHAYNYAAKYHKHHHLRKLAEDITDYGRKRITRNFMNDPVADFTSVMLLAQVFDEGTCNELLYNRGKYINYLYIPRLTSLNQDDVKFLRKAQLYAVTDKDNKGSDLATYNISLDDKINTLNLLAANRQIIDAGFEGINFNNYVTPVNKDIPAGNFRIDFQNIKLDLTEKALKYVGVNPTKVDKYIRDYKKAYKDNTLSDNRHKFWDINFAHLLVAKEGTLLRDIIVSAQNDKFKDMIFKKGPIAEINAKNRAIFEANKLDYDKWLNPEIQSDPKPFINKPKNKPKEFIVTNWNRIPQESLFDGNYTTCCTGIDKDHGDSFLHYLTNTATTTLEVRTADKKKVVAMSRLLVAKINGKLSLVVENIEVNNKMAKHYLYDDKTKQKFREMIFDYARKFAKKINKTGEEMPVYFSARYYKIKDIEKGLNHMEKYVDPEMIGVYPNNIYINSYGDNWDQYKIRDDGDEFNLLLSDITHKSKPVVDKNSDSDCDSSYNHGDTAYFNHSKKK